jgi:subtilisin family serine protease
MRKTLISAIAVAVTAAGAVALTATAAGTAAAGQDLIINAGSPAAVPGRYIVVFKDSIFKDSVFTGAGQSSASVSSATSAMTSRYGGKVRHRFDKVLNGYSGEMSAEQAAEIATDPSVQYVQQVVSVSGVDTQNNPPNWGVDRIDQQSLPLNSRFDYPSNPGQGVRVYVLDSGINANHADFSGRIAAGRDFVDGDTTPQDCHGHGTHVAGTAAGTAYGVAKKATIVPVRVLNCQGGGADDDLVAAANWVAGSGVKPAVVNYSIGCRQRCSTPAMDTAARGVVAAGIQWVQAAGNSNDDACYYSPQKVSETITVGNSNRSDQRRSDSNYGTCLDIWAPGTDIVSASHTSNTGTTTMSGTSMASPHVAGAVALYLQRNPSATSAKVRNALVDNASTGKLTGINSGSPNTLLNTSFLNGGTPEPGAVTVANPGDRTATVGLSFTLNNSATGGTAPYTWSATGLPAGLSISSSTGTISGTPTAATTATATLTARDTTGRTGTASFRITVSTTGGTQCAPRTNPNSGPIYDWRQTQSAITVSGCSGTASPTSTVAVNIRHTAIGDLQVWLSAPDGTTYLLHNRTGGTTDNLVRTFTVNLSSEPRNGRWLLNVYDYKYGDTGTVTPWTLTL